MTTRPQAVAGLFYEADPVRLQRHVDSLLQQAPTGLAEAPRGLIVPHAGYVYSGETAAAAYRCLEACKQQVKRVALFGPAHRVYLQRMALPSVDAFATPLGVVPLDRDAIGRIAGLPGVSVSDEAHRQEHSLEVQLPFLQRSLGDFTLVPVVVGHCPPQQVAAVMDALWSMPGTLLVVSTDLSHFHDYGSAERIDRLTCERLLAKAADLDGEEACGANALNGLMCSEHMRQLDISLLQQCNSGDTAGSKDRVVGYGAFVLN
jgi:AmmeMemoRadiSam system protein B